LSPTLELAKLQWTVHPGYWKNHFRLRDRS